MFILLLTYFTFAIILYLFYYSFILHLLLSYILLASSYILLKEK